MSSQNMPLITQDSGDRDPGPSGTNTPPSTRSSSLSADSYTSSVLFPDNVKRSSLKSSLKSPQPQSASTSRTSSPPSVRFADLGPVTEAKSKTCVQPYYQKQIKAHPNQVPNPLIGIRQHPVLSVSSARHSISPQSFAAQPPQTASAPQSRYDKMHAIRRFSAPMQTAQPDPRWSGIPLPAGYAPPTRLSKSSRNSSFHSAISNLSVQSAPPNLTNASTDAPIGQYNPLEHYVPCMYPGCNLHYSAAHTGPTYYLPLGSYSISRLQGFCSRHATKDHKEASARCKREYESLRQGAGRKTLGQIAQEFELFLDALRQDRQQESADLLQEQKQVVLGISTAGSKQQAVVWNWRYMPRPCTKAGCQREHYSPFSNHLYAFYFTRRASSFLPMHTLCPSCSKAEIENFENSIHEKWTSRCGWDDDEWEQWFCNAVKDRDMELEFWDKGQERVVREKGPPRWAQRAADAQDAAEEKSVLTKPLQKRKSLLKKWFTISA